MTKKAEDKGVPLTARDIILAAYDEPLLRGVPCLLGPSGGGKTWLVQAIHKDRHPDGVLVTLVPAQESGDELGGIPLKPTKAGQSVEWTLPVAIPQELLDKGGTIFVDEMDKAAPDVWPVLLRLLAERMLRNTPLPSNVDLVCAANAPEVPLPDVLVSRLLWIRFPEPEDFGDPTSWTHKGVSVIPASVTARIVERMGRLVQETAFPPIVPSTRAIHRLASWLRWPMFWQANQQARSRLLMGVLPQELIPETLANLTEPTINTAELALAFLNNCTPAELDAKFLDVLFSLPTEVVIPFYEALDKRAEADKTGEFERIWTKATAVEVRAAYRFEPGQAAARKWWLEQPVEGAKAAAKNAKGKSK